MEGMAAEAFGAGTGLLARFLARNLGFRIGVGAMAFGAALHWRHEDIGGVLAMTSGVTVDACHRGMLGVGEAPVLQPAICHNRWSNDRRAADARLYLMTISASREQGMSRGRLGFIGITGEEDLFLKILSGANPILELKHLLGNESVDLLRGLEPFFAGKVCVLERQAAQIRANGCRIAMRNLELGIFGIE